MNPTQFFKVLFDHGESICLGEHVYDTNMLIAMNHSTSEIKITGFPFFAINPMHKKRLDANVTAFRNILVEFDTGTIEQQYNQLKKSNLPYSTIVFSGNKSLHAIVSLKPDVQDRVTYDVYVRQIYNKLQRDGAEIDISTKNPSRLSRTPSAIRENGKEQTLLEVHNRIDKAELVNWLGEDIYKLSPYKIMPEVRFENKRRLLSSTASAFLAYGAPDGQWNTRLFMAACDVFRAGYSLDEAEGMFAQVTGQLDKSDLSTIRSAQRSVQRGSL